MPPEELTYRSALLGLWLGNGSRASAVAWSSALFGLSHILPTRSTMGQTALGQHLERRPLRQAAFVAGNVAVTGAAGAVFGWLRLRSGSVLAPLLAGDAARAVQLGGLPAARWRGAGGPGAGKKGPWPFPRREPGGIIRGGPVGPGACRGRCAAARPVPMAATGG